MLGTGTSKSSHYDASFCMDGAVSGTGSTKRTVASAVSLERNGLQPNSVRLRLWYLFALTDASMLMFVVYSSPPRLLEVLVAAEQG